MVNGQSRKVGCIVANDIDETLHLEWTFHCHHKVLLILCCNCQDGSLKAPQALPVQTSCYEHAFLRPAPFLEEEVVVSESACFQLEELHTHLCMIPRAPLETPDTPWHL